LSDDPLADGVTLASAMAAVVLDASASSDDPLADGAPPASAMDARAVEASAAPPRAARPCGTSSSLRAPHATASVVNAAQISQRGAGRTRSR
jgi:hypothetical protein